MAAQTQIRKILTTKQNYYKMETRYLGYAIQN